MILAFHDLPAPLKTHHQALRSGRTFVRMGNRITGETERLE